MCSSEAQETLIICFGGRLIYLSKLMRCCWLRTAGISFLEVVTQLWKVPISFIIFGHLHLSALLFWPDSCEIWYCALLWKSVEEIQILSKVGKNVGHFTWIVKYILLLLATLICHKSSLWVNWYQALRIA